MGNKMYFDKKLWSQKTHYFIKNNPSKVRIISIIGAVTSAGVLVFGLANPAISSATVPGINERVSVDSSGSQANQVNYAPSISGDGRYVAFESQASNLVPGDTNGARDIFVRDRTSGTTTRVSVSSSGVESNSDSTQAKISHSGRYVVFASYANNLVSGDTNNVYDIFMYDMTNATLSRVSTSSTEGQQNSGAGWPDVSADGRFVVFETSANNLDPTVTGTSNGQQVFLKDTTTGAIKMLSRSTANVVGNGASRLPHISCDGGVVTFASDASNLVANDTNGYGDIFVNSLGWNADQITNITLGGNHHSNSPDISCNGNAVAYHSGATNLVSGSTNGGIFAYNRLGATTAKVSVYSNGAQATASSQYPSISEDGRFVAFQSREQFQTADTNSDNDDIYVHDTKDHTTQLVSINSSSYAAGWSTEPAISADGAYIAYQSAANSLVAGDTNGYQDIFASRTGF